MRVALIDAQGQMFTSREPAGHPWQINMDKYSGFIREPSGYSGAAERRDVEDVHTHHGSLNNPSPIRIFPRQVDATLFGGLARFVRRGAEMHQAIRARYHMAGVQVSILDIYVDDKPVVGGFRLKPMRGCLQ